MHRLPERRGGPTLTDHREDSAPVFDRETTIASESGVQISSHERGHQSQAAAERPSSKTALLLLTALVVLLADQASKVAVRELLRSSGTNSIPLLDGWVRITHVENRGAAFGLLQNQTIFFVIVGIIVVAGILFGHRLVPAHRTTLALCLGLQLGGATGNLIDRIRNDGSVFDFIHLPNFPVFNVADSAIVVGVAILAFHLLLDTPRRQPTSSDPGQ